MTPDRALVIACLHHTGELNRKVPARIQQEAYHRCDGFGDLPPEALSDINGGWDWSHVRDSTEQGFARAAAYLRQQGFALPN